MLAKMKYKCNRCGKVIHISITDKPKKKFKAHKVGCIDLDSKQSHPGFKQLENL